jgi:hypothetical protein
MKLHFGAVVAATVALAACGGGGGNTLAPTPTPSPTPTPTPAPLSVSPNSVSYTSLADTPLVVTISEAGYSGAFTISTAACANIASTTSTSATAFKINPTGSGACTIAITDSYGQSATVNVSVTQTLINGH